MGVRALKVILFSFISNRVIAAFFVGNLMAYVQIHNTVPHYHTDDGSLASGYVIKAYLEGTSTATNLYTDSAGTSAGTSIALNARGEPEVSGNTIIPYFDDSIIYKLSLYPTQAAADADTGAEWSIDGINPAASVSSLKFIGQYSDNLATAISDIGSTETTLWIDKSISVTEDATIPSTLTLKFLHGGDLNVSATKTVTVNGGIEAGRYKIFTGAGDVVISQPALVEWYGAVRDGATSDDAAFQKAADNAPGMILTGNANGDTYYLDTSIELPSTPYEVVGIGGARIDWAGSAARVTSNAITGPGIFQYNHTNYKATFATGASHHRITGIRAAASHVNGTGHHIYATRATESDGGNSNRWRSLRQD